MVKVAKEIEKVGKSFDKLEQINIAKSKALKRANQPTGSNSRDRANQAVYSNVVQGGRAETGKLTEAGKQLEKELLALKRENMLRERNAKDEEAKKGMDARGKCMVDEGILKSKLPESLPINIVINNDGRSKIRNLN